MNRIPLYDADSSQISTEKQQEKCSKTRLAGYGEFHQRWRLMLSWLINQSINRSINQETNLSINQSIDWQHCENHLAFPRTIMRVFARGTTTSADGFAKICILRKVSKTSMANIVDLIGIHRVNKRIFGHNQVSLLELRWRHDGERLSVNLLTLFTNFSFSQFEITKKVHIMTCMFFPEEKNRQKR